MAERVCARLRAARTKSQLRQDDQAIGAIDELMELVQGLTDGAEQMPLFELPVVEMQTLKSSLRLDNDVLVERLAELLENNRCHSTAGLIRTKFNELGASTCAFSDDNPVKEVEGAEVETPEVLPTGPNEDDVAEWWNDLNSELQQKRQPAFTPTRGKRCEGNATDLNDVKWCAGLAQQRSERHKSSRSNMAGSTKRDGLSDAERDRRLEEHMERMMFQ